MKKSRTPTLALATWILFSLALLPVAVTTALAQSQTGTIEGRVQNELTGRYLNNARVSIKGTDLQVYTDETGRYRLTNLPSGVVTLEVLYSGLEKHEATVGVTAGQIITRNIGLAPGHVPGQENVFDLGR